MSSESSINSLEDIVKKLGRRGEDVIPVGRDLTDIFGRKLKLESQAIDVSTNELNEKTKILLKELQTEGSQIEKILRGQVMCMTFVHRYGVTVQSFQLFWHSLMLKF